MTTTHQTSLPGGRTPIACSRSGEGVPVVLPHGLLGSFAGSAEVCSGLDRPCLAREPRAAITELVRRGHKPRRTGSGRGLRFPRLRLGPALRFA
jgi:hypothetical protein